ncbi:MAG: hypothetical protein FK733_05855, partial [Asgard group archaeon]|nr:hypothetical protein [Asgard group archaeon]
MDKYEKEDKHETRMTKKDNKKIQDNEKSLNPSTTPLLKTKTQQQSIPEEKRGDRLGSRGRAVGKTVPDKEKTRSHLKDLCQFKLRRYYKTPYPIFIRIIKMDELLTPTRGFHDPKKHFSKDIYDEELLGDLGIFDCNFLETTDSNIRDKIFESLYKASERFDQHSYPVKQYRITDVGNIIEEFVKDEIKTWGKSTKLSGTTIFPDVA